MLKIDEDDGGSCGALAFPPMSAVVVVLFLIVLAVALCYCKVKAMKEAASAASASRSSTSASSRTVERIQAGVASLGSDEKGFAGACQAAGVGWKSRRLRRVDREAL